MVLSESGHCYAEAQTVRIIPRRQIDRGAIPPSPKALKRLFFGGDKRYLKIMRSSMLVGIQVVIAEIFEFIFQTKFIPQGSLDKLPGLETHLPLLK